MEKLTKLLTPNETAKALVETIAILNAATQTTDILYTSLMAFRERKVKFVVGDVESMDAESDRAFDEACAILLLMKEGIPQRIAKVLIDGECASTQNAPSVETLQ